MSVWRSSVSEGILKADIPVHIEDVSPQWLSYVLREHKIIEEGQVKSVKFASLGINRGFLGQIYRVFVTYTVDEAAPTSFVVKLSSARPEMKEVGRDYQFYAREVSFYSKLTHRLRISSPLCYYSAINNSGMDHVLLLEDLASLENGDRVKGCSAYDAALVVDQLAILHAQWLGSDELARLTWLPDLASIYDLTEAPETFTRAWKVFKEKIAPAPPYLVEIATRYADRVISITNHLFSGPLRTLLHFDCHLDNLFFDRRPYPAGITFVDWQLVTRGVPAVDVALLLGQNIDPTTRRENEGYLLTLYHRRLGSTEHPEYSIDQLQYDYRLSLLYHLCGLIYTLGADSFTDSQDKLIIDHILPRNLIAAQESDVLSLLL